MPRVYASDFNELLTDNDKVRGRPEYISRSLEFKDYLDRCDMLDLGFSSPRFTWKNKRDVGALI